MRAFGVITKNITAEKIPSGVWAYETISGNVTARADSAEVMSWGEISGNVSGIGANVRAYGDISGDVKGGSGTATVTSWEDARGNADADGNVVVRALSNVGKDGGQSSGDKQINSGTGKAEVWAGGDIAVVAKAKGFVGLYAKRSVDKTGGASSSEDEVWVQSEKGDIVGGNYAGKLGVNLTAGGDIGKGDESVSENSSAGYVFIDAGGGVHVSNATGKDDVWVAARTGNLSGNFTSTDSWLYAWSKKNLEGNLTAQQIVSASAWGDIKADLKSEADGVEAITDGKFSGKITGATWVTVDARGNIDGEIKAGLGEESGEVSIRCAGDIKAKVVSTGDVELSAGGSVTGGATATSGWLDVSAGETIYGAYVSFKWLSLWSDGTVAASATSVGDVEIVSGGAVLPMGNGFHSTEGEVWVNGVKYRGAEIADKENEGKKVENAVIEVDDDALKKERLIAFIGKFNLPPIAGGLDVHTKISIKWETYRLGGPGTYLISKGEYIVWFSGGQIVDSLRSNKMKINLSPKHGGHMDPYPARGDYPNIEYFDLYEDNSFNSAGTRGWLSYEVETKGFETKQDLKNYQPQLKFDLTGPYEKPTSRFHLKDINSKNEVSRPMRPNRIREMVDESKKIVQKSFRSLALWSLDMPPYWENKSSYGSQVLAKISWEWPVGASKPVVDKEIK